MSSSSQVVESWIASFCNLLGHEYFAEVSEDFIEDDFNLTGLSSQVPHYKEALEMILDVEPEDDEDEEDEEEEEDEDDEEKAYKRDRRNPKTNADLNQIESSAELLYGLIHQRYIVSRPGMSQMHEKYELGHFGSCPRVYCNSCKVLPVGCSDIPGQETVKLYCPSCLDVYTPPNSRFQTVDGAFFGTTFGSLFFMTYPEIQYNTRNTDGLSSSSLDDSKHHSSNAAAAVSQPAELNGVSTANFAPGLGSGNIYEPRIYGFRVSERARSGPRMKWLRMKPDDIRDLDETTKFHAVEEMDEDYAADEEMEDAGPEAQAQSQQQQQQHLDRRKKAPIRRRRRMNSDENTVPMDTNGNGVNGVG